MRHRFALPLAASAVAATVLSVGGTAQAAAFTPTSNPGVTVWEHGGSNLGECSAYLATVLGVRGDINHVIKDYGAALGIASPGALYSVRARQATNAAPAQECLPRQLPGGGMG